MITLDLRDAIAQAVRDLGLAADGTVRAPAPGLPPELPPDPKLRPGPAPGTYTTSIAFGLSAIFRTTPAQVATRITRCLAATDWIAETVTAGGYITVTVTPEALASVATRITAAGADCVRSEVLRGVTLPGPVPAAMEAAQTWEDARAGLAAELTARLAEAAGATLLPSGTAPQAGTPGAATLGTAIPGTAGPGTGDRSDPEGAAGRRRERSRSDEGAGEGSPAGQPSEPVAAAVAVAGADAVRFALSRVIPGKPAAIDGASTARNSLDNPAYAVRYAHARAVSGVRWVAALSAPAQGEAAAPRLPADPADRALLDALSWLPERVAVAARRGRPDEFARYLEDLARATIVAVPFVRPGDDERLALTGVVAQAARTGLAAGLGLLGVAAPDRL
ncbi:MAG TPA: DALR anticodon-binding domain-containing protein [Trebonia sp.]|nr:DALR anticodon-binding domain-containing protein [Trebonia sp.]